MFVMRAKVSVTDGSAERLRFGIAGEEAAGFLRQCFASVPETENQAALVEQGLIVRLPGARARYLVEASADFLLTLLPSLSERFRQIDEAAWRLLDIRAGLPQVLPDTQEAFVPQMANLDLIGGISFKKGCYPGQEIVARMHYLGNLKRRMYRLSIVGEPPLPGVEVQTGEGASAGTVVMAAPAPEGGSEALAVLRIADAGGSLSIAGHPAEVAALPYELPAQKP